MARHLGLRHREAHVREQAAGAPLQDVSLRRLVRRDRSGPDRVEAELLSQPSGDRELGTDPATDLPIVAKGILAEEKSGLIVSQKNLFRFGNNHHLQNTNIVLVRKLLRDLRRAGVKGPDDL